MPRSKQYCEKNKHFQLWIPRSLHDYFLSYLQTCCQGETTAAQFRIFLYELKSLEDRGITIVKPRIDYERNRLNEMKARFGSNIEEICVRGINFKNKDQRDREIMCGYCQTGTTK